MGIAHDQHAPRIANECEASCDHAGERFKILHVDIIFIVTQYENDSN